MSDEYEYLGEIISPSASGAEAFVRLDKPVAGKKLVAITVGTLGRIEIMNGRGRLIEGTKVEGVAIPSVDALEALSVRTVAMAI